MFIVYQNLLLDDMFCTNTRNFLESLDLSGILGVLDFITLQQQQILLQRF
jgi:hypothetical protein